MMADIRKNTEIALALLVDLFARLSLDISTG